MGGSKHRGFLRAPKMDHVKNQWFQKPKPEMKKWMIWGVFLPMIFFSRSFGLKKMTYIKLYRNIVTSNQVYIQCNLYMCMYIYV